MKRLTKKKPNEKKVKQDKLAELEKRIEQLEKREPVIINVPPQQPQRPQTYPIWPWQNPVTYRGDTK